MICPDCDGKKSSLCHINTGADSSKHVWGEVQCYRCNGNGFVPDEMAEWIKIGKEKRKARAIAGITLYQKAKSLGISSAELSKIELGMVKNF